ncbi:MAG: LamG domain-containing protein [Saprospiraceae bacterium]|nr:LamG domain-containing protein [Saprospiraceae bacterium]
MKNFTIRNRWFYLGWILSVPMILLAQTDLSSLKKSLTFAATFDHNVMANFSQGEDALFMAPAYGELRDPAINQLPTHISRVDGGKVGQALAFSAKEKSVIFYRAEHNVAYSKGDWSGTVSLWMRVNPEEDLAPGYTDPIQITDSGYDDAALWVDFSDVNPRDFRMGVFGDVESWNPQKKNPDANPDFQKRLIKAAGRPFSSSEWTHVLMTFDHLNSGKGLARFYINGKLQGDRSIEEPFTWDESEAKIFIGLNYIGQLDEVSIFNRALQDSEIQKLYGLEGGIEELIDE